MPHRLLPLITLLTIALFATGCSPWRLHQQAQVATGFSAHVLCDDVFVTGRNADTAFDERVRPLPGMGPVAWALRREVDAAQRTVTVSLAGALASRARQHPALGCITLPAGAELPTAPAAEPPEAAPPPDPAGTAPVEPADPRLRDVLDRALAGTDGDPTHRTKALVVLHGGRIVGERYAPGFGADTPVLGFSASKSLVNILMGVLVHQGRLGLQQPAPVAAWRDPADPRHAITLEQLLRQTSGLDVPQDNSGADLNARILYTLPDKAGAAAAAPLAAPPGTRWRYTDAHYLLLSRVLRDATGGTAAGVRAFAQRELAAPLGLRQLHWDFDATGTPLGSSHVLASARDWARLGQLFLDDGMAGDRRLLPAGWVAWSTTPTLATGYGAGWWTNRMPGHVPGWGVPWGLPSAPADAYFARGFMGQYVVVVPSRRLVVVRLAVSHHRGDDIAETDRIVAGVLAALP